MTSEPNFTGNNDRRRRAPDTAEENAKHELRAIFEKENLRVFFSRQLEVRLERRYFHWITSRALRQLEEERLIISERRPLNFGGNIKLYWHRSNRYYKREAGRVSSLVEQYSAPQVSGALGHHGELMLIEAFARNEFILKGREKSAYGIAAWKTTLHDLDMIAERDGVGYGIEVKNTLSYMEEKELKIKIEICRHLGIRPVFAVRMLPATWIAEIVRAGGYAMVLEWQLYPLVLSELAKTIKEELGLPVDAPRALAQGTMEKFLRWHRRNM